MPGAVFNGTHEIEPRNLISSFLAPNPSAPSRAIERAPPPPSISFQPPNLGPPNLYPPPPAIRWRNPTPGSSILSGVLSTASPPCVFNRAAPAVPPPHPPYPGIHIRRYSQLFLTARTKSSRSAHYGHFLPQPTPPRRVIERAIPPPSVSFQPPNIGPQYISITPRYSLAKTNLQRLRFEWGAPNCFSSPCI